MAWFVYDENSTRTLQNDPEFRRTGVTFAQGNPLLEALGRRESVLLLPGTIAEAPFILHIQNHKREDDHGADRPSLRDSV